MAKERYFSGFEDGALHQYTTYGSPAVRGDATSRTGDFHFCTYFPSTAVAGGIERTFANAYTCSTDGAMVRGRLQVALRVRQLYGAQLQVFGYSDDVTGPPGPVGRVQMTTAGLLSASIPTIAGTPVATTTRPLTLGVWYVCRFEFSYQRNDAGNDPMFVSIAVYEGDTMDTEAPVLFTQAQASASANIVNFLLGGQPFLGTRQLVTRIVDYDDWWYAVGSDGDVNSADLNWPEVSRVQAVPITRQGAQAQFAGSYLLCRDIPNDATVAVDEQTATGSGLQTTFGHKTAAELGLIPVGQLATTGSATEQAAAPPFSGLPVPEGLSDAAAVYMAQAQDATLPVPTISSVTPTAGAGSYNVGVFVRAFTVEWRSTGTGMSPVCGPLSGSQYISAAQYPNFAASVVVAFGANTPADRFLDPSSPGTSAYRRYGIGLLVTNAYSNRAGSALLNPFPTSPNTTNLLTFDSREVPNNPFGQLVALFGVGTPGGTQPPYEFTNPGQRASGVTFRLSQPIQSSGGGGVGEGFTTVSQFRYVFRAPALVGDSDKPVVAALKVIVQAKRSSGSGNDNILLGGALHPVAVGTAYGSSQFAIDWTERTAAQFDLLEFGFATASGTATQLGNCLAEVLTAGPCTRKSAGRGQYQQQVGLIVPNASYQTIPVNFTDSAGEPVAPTFVMVKHVRTGTGRPGAYKAWWMGGTLAAWGQGTLTSTPDSVAIMLLEPGGFLIGPSVMVNQASGVYVYLAVYDGGQDTVNDAYFVTGSYERQSGLDPDATVELGVPLLFQPNWVPTTVFIFGPNGPVLKTDDMAAGDSDIWSTTGLVTNGITSVGAGVFATGTAAGVATGGQYCYFAYRNDPGGLLAQVFQEGSFAGTGGTLVVPTNFRAALLALDHPQAGYDGQVKSDAGSSAALSTPWAGPPEVASNLTAIADLSFTAGALASVLGQTSFWLAWKINGRIGNSGSSNLPPPGDPGGDDPSDDICAGGGMKVPPGTTGGHGCTDCASPFRDWWEHGEA